jgi:hypothetical protein
VIPTVRDSPVRGSVSCSAEAFPEVHDERIQTQRRNFGRVSEYRPRKRRPPYKTISRPSPSLDTTHQGCGTKWSTATANPDATGTVFRANIGLSTTVYVQVHRCLLIRLISCLHLLRPTIHSLRSSSVTASCGPHSLTQ